MPKHLPQSDNRTSWPKPLLTAVVVGSGLAYLLLFFSQASVIGFTDSDGQRLTRFVDVTQILLLEHWFDSMRGYGRLEFGVFDRLPIVAGMLVYAALAGWIGWPLIRGSGLCGRCGRLEQLCLAVLVGLAIISTCTLVLGLAGGLHNRWPMLSVLAALGLTAGMLRWLQRRRGTHVAGNSAGSSGRSAVQPASMLAVWLWRLIPVGTVGLATMLVLGSSMPPWEFDVLEYHLQAPKEFHRSGSIEFNLHNVYANMPLGAEMHSLVAMTVLGGADAWWLGGLIGKAITGGFSLLAAGLLGGFIARIYGTWSGWSAAGLLLAAPGNAHVAMAGLIDMVLATYLLAAVLVCTVLWSQLRIGKASFHDLFLVSLLAGAAAACKYTGLLFVVFPLGAAVVFPLLKSLRFQPLLNTVAAGGLGLAITCGPWYAKNYQQSGNPFFPLATQLFGTASWSTDQVHRWQEAHQVPNLGSDSAYSWLAVWDSLTQLGFRSSFLHPTLVFLTICGVLSLRRPPAGFPSKWAWGWLAMLAWVLAVWWFATHRIDRFWLPVLPLACGLASLGATWIGQRLSLSLASMFVLLGMLYGGFMNASGAIGDNRFLVSLDALRSDIGNHELAGRLSPAVVWANQELFQGEEKLLLIGEAKVFDFRMPIVYATCFNISPAETWLRDKSVDEQRANLAASQIAHVLINWSELARYRSRGNYGFSDWPQRDDIEALVESQVLRPMYVPNDVEEIEVFEVIEP